MSGLEYVEIIIGYLVCGIVGLFGVLLLLKMANGTINLAELISENGRASTSRFQLVVFTFVVALSFFLVVVAHVKVLQAAHNVADVPGLPDVPSGVLALLGISASSFLVSKSISESNGGTGGAPKGPDPVPVPPPAQKVPQ
jgi:hypothetical protein